MRESNSCPLLENDENARAINRIYRRIGNRGKEKFEFGYGELADKERAEALSLSQICLACRFLLQRGSKEKPCPAPTNKRVKMCSIVKYLRENN